MSEPTGKPAMTSEKDAIARLRDDLEHADLVDDYLTSVRTDDLRTLLAMQSVSGDDAKTPAPNRKVSSHE